MAQQTATSLIRPRVFRQRCRRFLTRSPCDVDGATRDRAASAARAAGLNLSDRQFAMLCAAAPYVEAMTERLYRERHWAEEPANIFLFGG